MRQTTQKKLRKQLTEFKKGQIVAWHESAYTDHEIGKKLNRWCTTIRRFLFKYHLTGSSKCKEGSERRCKTTAREDRLIIREVRKNRKITMMNGLFFEGSILLGNLNLTGALKNHLFLKVTGKKRLQWAKQYQNWTIEQWKNVLWSDESPFCLRFSGRSRVWRLHNECYDPLVTQPTVKHDKKVNVWGCFTSSGVGR